VIPLQVVQLPPFVRSLLQSEYAFLFLFGVFVLEGAMLMYVMPSELIVPGAILLIGSDPATTLVIVGVAVAGATVGQVALFLLARHAGREYLLENRWIRVSESQLERFDGWFERWGPVAVPVSNTLLLTRGMLTIPAGLAGMNRRKFVVFSALGTLSFESILAVLYLAFDTVL
jgi:membrane protein DedA with SNARE-associated domain